MTITQEKLLYAFPSSFGVVVFHRDGETVNTSCRVALLVVDGVVYYKHLTDCQVLGVSWRYLCDSADVVSVL